MEPSTLSATFFTSPLNSVMYWFRWSSEMLLSPILTSRLFAAVNVLEMLVNELIAVVTRPLAFPSCWFTDVNALTSDRTFCATANAPPSSVASATR